MSDSHSETLKRQQEGQRLLEEDMNRHETQQQRDQQLQTLEQWLNKQLK